MTALGADLLLMGLALWVMSFFFCYAHWYSQMASWVLEFVGMSIILYCALRPNAITNQQHKRSRTIANESEASEGEVSFVAHDDTFLKEKSWQGRQSGRQHKRMENIANRGGGKEPSVDEEASEATNLLE